MATLDLDGTIADFFLSSLARLRSFSPLALLTYFPLPPVLPALLLLLLFLLPLPSPQRWLLMLLLLHRFAVLLLLRSSSFRRLRCHALPLPPH